MDKSAHDADPRELCNAAISWYDAVYVRFKEFRVSSIGAEYRDALNPFIHYALRDVNNLRYAVTEGELPERGRSSMLWVAYNKTLTNIRIMELILDLRGRIENE